MSNPMLDAAVSGNDQISQLAKMLKMAKSPSQLISSNPQLQTLLAMHRGDARAAFYSLCKQRGIDPESILSQLR